MARIDAAAQRSSRTNGSHPPYSRVSMIKILILQSLHNFDDNAGVPFAGPSQLHTFPRSDRQQQHFLWKDDLAAS